MAVSAQFTETELNATLAALRHFQAAISAGEDLTRYDEIINLDTLDTVDIDRLCEKINTDTRETYAALALSTAHISKEEAAHLQELVDQDHPMVFARDTGFLIKLYAERPLNNYLGDSDGMRSVLNYAHKDGYQLIEFDADAECYFDLPVHEW